MAKKPKSYKQTDSRWAGKPYRVKGKENSTIGGSGCGPTSAAMLVATYKDSEETPLTACNWSMEKGYKAVGQGTYYTFFAAYFKAHGMKCEQVPGGNSYHKKNTDADKKALAALKAGKYVIACMGPGIWTNGGHFVLAYDYKNGQVYINDPASSKAVRAENTWDKFQYEAKYYWIIDASKEEAPKTPEKKPEKESVNPPIGYKAKVIAKAGLNVRTGRGVGYKKIKALKYGTEVTVYETKNGWCRIHEKENQWVSGDYVKRV